MLSACKFNLEELIEKFKDEGLSFSESGLSYFVTGDCYVSIQNCDEYEMYKGRGRTEAIGFILIRLKDGYGMLPFASVDIELGMERLIPSAFRYVKTDDAVSLVQIQKEYMTAIKVMDEVMHKMRIPLLFEDITPEKIKEWRGF